MRPSSAAVGGGVAARSGLIAISQPIVSRTIASVAPGWSESSRIWPAVIEVIDPEVGHHDRWTPAQPAAFAPDSLGVGGSTEGAGRRPEVDGLDEAALALAHDHEDLAGVDRDLAGAAGPRQSGRGVRVVADDRGVDVAEPIDLGRPQESDVDQAALQVVAEQLDHADHGGRAGHDRRVADRQRQSGRPGAEDAGFVDQLELRRDGPLGEVDRDVRQPDPDEADALAGQRTSGRHDHHLGLRERRGGHRYSP